MNTFREKDCRKNVAKLLSAFLLIFVYEVLFLDLLSLKRFSKNFKKSFTNTSG